MNFSDTVLCMVYTCSLIVKITHSLSKNIFLENKFTCILVLVHAMANMCVCMLYAYVHVLHVVVFIWL